MKISTLYTPDLQLGRQTRRGTTFSPYIIKPDNQTYHFQSALLDIINHEGDYDDLDSAPTNTTTTNGAQTTDSPLSSPPSSPLSSPPSSPSSSHIDLPLLPTPKPMTHQPTIPSFQPSELSEPGSSEVSTNQKRKGHAKRLSKNNRKKRRRLEAAARAAEDTQVHEAALRKHVSPSHPIHVQHSLGHQPRVASSGYIGLRFRMPRADRQYWVEELVGPQSAFQYELIRWNPDHSIFLVDEENRVIILFAGHPNDPEWPSVVRAATEQMDGLRQSCVFSSKQKSHRRGLFPALSTGISHGGGQTRPGNLVNNKANTKVLNQLVSYWAFRRLSGFANSVFHTWAPRLFQYYAEHLKKLLDSDTALKRLFRNSVFAAATFNFGPHTVCFDHIDFANLPFGWCGIWSLGNYDHTRGGHIVLPDYQVVVEFPPGNLIFIPSGVCVHSNTKIQSYETRMSFTQYSAGTLFCWVDHGFQVEKRYRASLSSCEAKQEEQRKHSRWQMGLGLFSTLAHLKIPI